MVEQTQINLRVSEEQKDRWEEYLQKNGRFNSLSDLIRASVETEINSEQSNESLESPALTNDIAQLKDDLQKTREDIRWIREQHESKVDISDIAQEVFDELRVLPEPPSHVPDEVDDVQAFKRREAARQVIRPNGPEDGRSPQTTSAIAKRLGISEPDVRDSIEHLEEQFLPVIDVEIDNQIHYFKEE